MRSDKKGVVATTMRMMLLVVAILLLFGFVYSLFAQTKRALPGELCKADIAKLALARNTSRSFTHGLTDIYLGFSNCHTYTLEFFKDHVEKYRINAIDGKKVNKQTYVIDIPRTTTTQYKELTSEMVHYVVAEELATCWKQFLRGKKEIFLNNPLYLNDFNDNEEVCFICNTIEFSSELPLQEYEGFWDFFRVARMKDRTGTYGETYYDVVVNHTRKCAFYENLYKDIRGDDALRKGFIQYLNEHYGYHLDPDKPYASLNDFPSDLCWNLFVDGFPHYQFNAATIGVTHFTEPHPAVVRDINFSTNKQYAIVLIRMGQDRAQTYASYVVPHSKLNELCDKPAI